ncbi:MAG: ATP-binding protein [Gemmataceae bacterium]
MLAALPLACFSLDLDWRFTTVNRAAERLFERLGRQSGPLLGRDIRQECPEVADSAFSRQCREALAEQGPVEAEVYYPALNRWFAVHVAPAPGRLCVFLRDVGERAALERELRRRADELAETDRGKDAFLHQLAHEVRNGLTPVRDALHLACSRDVGEDALQACVLAEQEVRFLSRLMEDLLRVSRLALAPPKKQRVNLADLAGRALAGALTSGGSGRTLSVHLPPEPLWIEADPAQVELALRHLLDNAVKFTAPGGHIWLSAGREGAEVVLRVKDDGAGIEPASLSQVFNLFMRQVGGRPHAGGLGVGLTLVRRVVQQHGGAVEALSDGPGRGSEFVVRLPAPDGADPSQALTWRVAGADGSPLDVLLVDDSHEITQTLSLLLTSWGCSVRTAGGGPAALEAVRDRRPDLVLLDICMPGMDGYEVARRLREEVGDGPLTVAALTGYDQEEVNPQATGFDFHMVKPVDHGDLKNLLAYVASGKRGEGSAAGSGYQG